RLVYRNGELRVRFLWWFRTPNDADLRAASAAQAEVERRWAAWDAQGLIPTTEVPEVMEDRRPREYGMRRWCDLFRPRQLLTNLTVLEEIRAAGQRLRQRLTAAE